MKAIVYSLTSVPPEKQKFICKGKFIKNDETLNSVPFGPSCVIKLIGKAEDKAKDYDNIEKKVFIEDLTPEERAAYLKDNFGVLSFLIVIGSHSIWYCKLGKHLLH